ncbi:hypothetical protein MUK42_15308 [Musa troglodytarum]|uniref:Uncharacterized protein n=1 Tax=Musa troglodytarum TaxID=320322 RepID=A0A9E7L9N4_9LILI|nr:hypothetical protein MUK42_15308 [Musa troglodytarum]
MERGEPTLAPEWYKGSTSSASASGNSNHRSRSSFHSGERGARHPSRNRSSLSACDLDASRSSAFSDGSLSSFRRSVSSNSSLTHDRVSTSSLRSYNSFGRNHRDKDREKEHDQRERNRSYLVENGSSNYTDAKNERDTLRRNPSFYGRQSEASSKNSSSNLSNGIIPGTITMHINTQSFEKEFPILGADDRQSDVARMSSLGLTTALNNLSRTTSAGIKGDGWTSALAEVPARVGGNGPATSSATSTALSSSTRLNMAEALAQAPSNARTPSQASVGTQKVEEFTRLQYTKLIPITPSTPKSSAHNSLEKSKVRGTRSGESCVSLKIGLQSSSQTIHASARSDSVKTSQAGNLQVITFSPKSTVNPKQKLDNKGVSPSTQTSYGEKRPSTQAQNRNDFFNIIRQKSSLDPPELSQRRLTVKMSDSDATGDKNVASEGPNKYLLNSEDETASSDLVAGSLSLSSDHVLLKCVSDGGDENLSLGPTAAVSMTASPAVSGEVGSSPESVMIASVPKNVTEIISDFVPSPCEEEATFLESLGWDINADEEPLTPEEIAEFYQKESSPRWAARPDSPELVRVSEASPESSFRVLDYVFSQVLCSNFASLLLQKSIYFLFKMRSFFFCFICLLFGGGGIVQMGKKVQQVSTLIWIWSSFAHWNMFFPRFL